MHYCMHTVALVLFSCYATCIATRPQDAIVSNSQAILGSEKYIFRDAIKEDVDDFVTVFLDAFSPGAAWHYIRPEYEKYKDYAWYCLRESILEQWDGIKNTTFLKVVAVPSTKTSSGRSQRVVSGGVWNLMRNDTESSTADPFTRALYSGLSVRGNYFDTNHQTTKYNCSAHLDVNKTRSDDAQPQMDRAQTRYIDNAYPKQLYLNLLATHPDWDGHGFAALNLHWGIELAKTLKEPVTLMASPAGYPLYHDVGFRDVKNVSITTLDGWGGGVMWSEVMEYPWSGDLEDKSVES